MKSLSLPRSCLALLLVLGAAGAQAQNVAQVFRDAQVNDATYAAARYALEAGREKLPQGRALMLPTLNLSANVTEQRFESDSRNTAVSPSFVRRPGSYGYTLSSTGRRTCWRATSRNSRCASPKRCSGRPGRT